MSATVATLAQQGFAANQAAVAIIRKLEAKGAKLVVGKAHRGAFEVMFDLKNDTGAVVGAVTISAKGGRVLRAVRETIVGSEFSPAKRAEGFTATRELLQLELG